MERYDANRLTVTRQSPYEMGSASTLDLGLLGRFVHVEKPSKGLSSSMGEAAAASVVTFMHNVDGKDLCRIHVRPCGFLVDATVRVERDEQMEKKEAFYVRVGNGTKELGEAQQEKCIVSRWSDDR